MARSSTWIALCATFALFSAVQAALVGIDFGSQVVKISVVQPGRGFDIVLDETSKRSFANQVAFDTEQRMFGTSATSLVTRRPDATFQYMRHLLGKSMDSPQLDTFTSVGFPYEFVASDRSTVSVRVPNEDGEDGVEVMPVETLVAMVLQHGKRITDAHADVSARDCVITVPGFWGQAERQAIMDAAEIAGFNVLALINQNAAGALQLGIDYDYSSEEDEYVLIYNIGASHTEVSVVQYGSWVEKPDKKARKRTEKVRGQVVIAGVGYDEFLGGRDFDQAIADHLALDFNAKLGGDVDVRKSPRAMAKLRAAAEKAKKRLNVNKDSPVYVEGLHGDTDLSATVQRSDFLDWCAPLFERVLTPVKRALAMAKVKRSQIKTFQLLGGSSRLTRVKEILSEYFTKDLSINLNADEAMALGAAFAAANYSATFRVRPIGLVDAYPYSIGLRVVDLPDDPAAAELDEPFSKKAPVFTAPSRLGKAKAVSFFHDRSFHVTAFHSQPDALPKGVDAEIMSFDVTGLEELIAKHAGLATPKVSLSFKLDASGLFRLSRARAIFSEEVEVAVVEKKKPAAAKKDDAESAKDKAKKLVEEILKPKLADEEPAAAEEEDAEDADKAAAAAPADDDEDEDDKAKAEEPAVAADADAKLQEDAAAEGDEAAAAAAAAEGDEEPPKTRMETRLHKYLLDVAYHHRVVRPMSKEAKLAAREVLAKYDARDKATVETADARNTLEEYIYVSRDKLGDDEFVQQVVSDEQREAFSGALEAAEDWMYDDESPNTKAKFDGKLAELMELGSPIFFRASELSMREEGVDAAEKAFGGADRVLVELRTNMTWVAKEKVDELAAMLDASRTWLADKTAAQEEASLTDAPLFTSREIVDRIAKLRERSMKLLRIPKPKPKPTKKKTPAGKNATKDADAAGDQAAEDGADEPSDKSASPEAGDEQNAEDAAASDAEAAAQEGEAGDEAEADAAAAAAAAAAGGQDDDDEPAADAAGADEAEEGDNAHDEL